MPTRSGTLSLLCLFACAIAPLGAFAAPGVVMETPAPFPPLEATVPTQVDDQFPKLVRRVEVVYPASLIAQPVDDRVYVAFVVDSKGAVTKVRPIFGGHAECEAAAVAAVQRWEFTPGRHMGRSVSTQMTVEIRFVAETARAATP